jgi:hypothetical protein
MANIDVIDLSGVGPAVTHADERARSVHDGGPPSG